MKTEAIKKINKMGEVGSILIVIAKVFCIIGFVACLIGTICLGLLPKDFISFHAMGSGTIEVNMEAIGQSISAEDAELINSGKLLETFKQEKESVLFATDSFWQGVDVPGESLSQVIIVKLPFTVPNDPVFVARSEAIEKRGGSSFMELSVPEAVIKFRQGIGRLIRRGDDKGVVVVLDRRIYEKRYGTIFISSMPECKKMYAPLSEITSKINNFIFE